MLKFCLIIMGLSLLFAGAFALPGEGFPYSRQHTAHLGPFEASARTRERIPIPAPIGWLLVVAGAGLVLTGAYSKGR
jgi:hypothetical protein